MQDRFVGDVGDFGKYGLLRWLCGVTTTGRTLRLGVIWFWNPDSKPQVVHLDGPHPCQQAYLYVCNPSAGELVLRECDRELFEILRRIVIGRQRSVADVEQSGALPEDTVSFSDEVPDDDLMDRMNWFEDAIAAIPECDVIFLDPDNGLEPVDKQRDQVLPIHARHQDAAPFWDKGKSLIIYQHLNRNGNTEEQIGAHAAKLRYVLGIKGPPGEIIALVFHRRISRVFFVIPNPANPEVAELLRNRVCSFIDSPWGKGGHFTRVDC